MHTAYHHPRHAHNILEANIQLGHQMAHPKSSHASSTVLLVHGKDTPPHQNTLPFSRLTSVFH